MVLFVIQSTSKFYTAFTNLFQIILPLYFFLTLSYSSLHLTTIFIFIITCMTWQFIFTTQFLLHNLCQYISHLSVALYFSHSFSFILPSYNNFIYLFFCFSDAWFYLLFNHLQNFTQHSQLYFKSFCLFIFLLYSLIHSCTLHHSWFLLSHA